MVKIFLPLVLATYLPGWKYSHLERIETNISMSHVGHRKKLNQLSIFNFDLNTFVPLTYVGSWQKRDLHIHAGTLVRNLNDLLRKM